MKLLIALTGLLLMTATSFATEIQSRLAITSMIDSKFYVVIDGKRYDGQSGSLSLNHLSRGYHNIEVHEIRQSLWSSSRLIYSSSLLLKPSFLLHIMIDPKRKVTIDEKRMSLQELNNGRNFEGRDGGERHRKPVDPVRKRGYPSCKV